MYYIPITLGRMLLKKNTTKDAAIKDMSVSDNVSVKQKPILYCHEIDWLLCDFEH